MISVPRGDNPRMRNQSFIKTKSQAETKYYDVFLNSHQLQRVWPGIDLTQRSQPIRSIPITPGSIYSFLNGYPIVRETDQAIANDLGLKVGEDHFRADALSDAARHFGIASLAELEKLLREHRDTVIGLSRYFRPKGSDGEPANLHAGTVFTCYARCWPLARVRLISIWIMSAPSEQRAGPPLDNM